MNQAKCASKGIARTPSTSRWMAAALLVVLLAVCLGVLGAFPAYAQDDGQSPQAIASRHLPEGRQQNVTYPYAVGDKSFATLNDAILAAENAGMTILVTEPVEELDEVAIPDGAVVHLKVQDGASFTLGETAHVKDGSLAVAGDGTIAIIGKDAAAEQVTTEEVIQDGDVPLAAVQPSGVWSLCNVAMSIMCIVAALALFAGALRKQDESIPVRKRAERHDPRTPISMVVLGVAVAVFSAITVFLTQDFRLQAVALDSWSPLFVTAAVVNLLLVALDYRRNRHYDDQGGASILALM